MKRRSKDPRYLATVAKQRASGRAADRSRYPRLCEGDLADASRALGAIDGLFVGNDNYSKHTRKILAAQDRLQAQCDSDAWIAFLEVEEAVNARVNMMLAAVARWAFHEGRRSRR